VQALAETCGSCSAAAASPASTSCATTRPATSYVLEVNSGPGLTETSLLPMARRRAGMGFDDFVARVVELAVSSSTMRLKRRKRRRHPPLWNPGNGGRGKGSLTPRYARRRRSPSTPVEESP